METFEIIKFMSDGAELGWGNTYYHVIPGLINKYHLKVGAEIGVAYGGHSEAILKNTKVEKLYSVDPYQPDWDGTDGYTLPNTGEKFTLTEYEELYLHALHRTRKYEDRSVFLRCTGHEAFAIIQDKLDFVFIDAKHTYENLYTDLFLWSKKVRKGGIIAWHDYGHESYPGIKRAADHWFNEVNQEDGYVAWVFNSKTLEL